MRRFNKMCYHVELIRGQPESEPPLVWQPLFTNITNTSSSANGTWQFTDTNAIQFPVRYYRFSTPKSLFGNYERACFRAKGRMARRDEGEYP